MTQLEWPFPPASTTKREPPSWERVDYEGAADEAWRAYLEAVAMSEEERCP